MGLNHCKKFKSFYTEKGNNCRKKIQNGGEISLDTHLSFKDLT